MTTIDIPHINKQESPIGSITVERLSEFVFGLSRFVQGASKECRDQFQSAEASNSFKAFIETPSKGALFVYKMISQQDETILIFRVLHNTVPRLTHVSSILALLKDTGPIKNERDLQIINVPITEFVERSLVGYLKDLVSQTVGTFFDAFTRENQQTHNLSPSFTTTKRKISELTLALEQFQQEIKAPELLRYTHTTVREALAQSASTGESRPPVDFIDSALIENPEYINEIHSIVNNWIRLAQQITHLSHEPDDGSSDDEVRFWITLEHVLIRLKTQLESPEVTVSLEVLKKAKRFSATVSFIPDTGISQALSITSQYTPFLKEIPMQSFIAATDIQKLQEAISDVFHSLRKLKSTDYPVPRALLWIETFSKDIKKKLQLIIEHYHLMSLPFDDFILKTASIESFFVSLHEQLQLFIELARLVVRKRSEKYLLIKVNLHTDEMEEQLQYVKKFRSSHHDLYNIIHHITSVQTMVNSSDLFRALEFAYEPMKNLNCIDTSSEGTISFSAAEAIYKARKEQIEAQLIGIFRDRMDLASTFTQMIQVHQTFSFLLTRPSVVYAVQDHRLQLLKFFKDEVTQMSLQLSRDTPLESLLQLRGVTRISHAMLNSIHLGNKLEQLVAKLELVLGNDWSQYPDGQKLQADISSLESRLNTPEIYSQWFLRYKDLDEDLLRSKPVLRIVKNIATDHLQLFVNFEDMNFQFSKDIESLISMGFDVPQNLIRANRKVKQIFPIVSGLSLSLLLFASIMKTVDQYEMFQILLRPAIEQIIEQISHILDTTWNIVLKAQELKCLVQTESKPKEIQVFDLIMKTQDDIYQTYRQLENLIVFKSKLHELFMKLKECPYTLISIKGTLSLFQKIVNDLSINYNKEVMSNFVSFLNDELSEALRKKGTQELERWRNSFTNQTSQATIKSKHIVEIENRQVSIVPPLQYFKTICVQELGQLIEVVQEQQMLVSGSKSEINKFSFVSDLLYEDIVLCLEALEKSYQLANTYFNTWYECESLWHLNLQDVVSQLNNEIESWSTFVLEFNSARLTMDQPTYRQGPLSINCEQIYDRVTSKYDQWQGDILLRFAELLEETGLSLKSSLAEARMKLESRSIDPRNMKSTIRLIVDITEIQEDIPSWNKLVQLYESGQKILQRSRTNQKKISLSHHQLFSDFMSVTDLLNSRLTSLERLHDIIAEDLESEASTLSEKINHTKNKWNLDKPISGKLKPTDALEALKIFEKLFTDLEEEAQRINSAISLLKIPIRPVFDLQDCQIEFNDLEVVWRTIETINVDIEHLRREKWLNLEIVTLQQGLEGLSLKGKSTPVAIRQYLAFEEVLNEIKRLIETVVILNELKNPNIKLRHWNQLFELLERSPVAVEELTIGTLWDLDLCSCKRTIQDLVEQANGEGTIEDSLSKLQSTYQSLFFETIVYKGKYKIIKGWDRLFQQCSDDINLLASIHHSTHYKSFRHEVITWEDKLSELYTILHVWVDVQKQWIYLSGIFDESVDIQRLLPLEYSRFRNVSLEFTNLGQNLGLLVLQIREEKGLADKLNNQQKALKVIRKSLSKFLETQRDIYNRFYFLGDDDLVELIGQSSDLLIVSKHIQKLFPGVSTLIQQGTKVIGLKSPEQEVFYLNSPVLAQGVELVNFLRVLEEEIKCSLSSYITEAFSSWNNYVSDPCNDSLLLHLVESFPGQAIIVGLQLLWTNIIELNSLTPVEAEKNYSRMLTTVSTLVSGEINHILRRKLESVIIELLHQTKFISERTEREVSLSSPEWLLQQRFYFDSSSTTTTQIIVKQGLSCFQYGYEYLGIPPRLVYTPLTHKAFISMTQSLDQKLSTSLVGPAGTGKTETVKALGNNLGRMVLVFNCDELFDFQAVNRILLGICRVGAWACFDEFNRLDASTLSALSAEIAKIQFALQSPSAVEVEILNTFTTINRASSIFITSNPDYSGRSIIPENLKDKYRVIKLLQPDSHMIVQVHLTTQGFRNAQSITSVITPFFEQMKQYCSNQVHYDFGLRAFKGVLANCGARRRRSSLSSDAFTEEAEFRLVLDSLEKIVLPKLVEEDEKWFNASIKKFKYYSDSIQEPNSLAKKIRHLAKKNGFNTGSNWIKKLTQMHDIQTVNNGVILVGPSGSGKTTARRLLFQAMNEVEDGADNICHIINAKVLRKEDLIGSFDIVTREWTDGVFTSLLRQVNLNLKGESCKRVWFVFDGAIDPVWIESLNSVLDDNKVLTLASGERLFFPENCRVIFEVESLNNATSATISRCGIVWFGESLFSIHDVVEYEICRLADPTTQNETSNFMENTQPDLISGTLEMFASEIRKYLKGNLLNSLIESVSDDFHVESFSRSRIFTTLFALLREQLNQLLSYIKVNASLTNFSFTKFIRRSLLVALMWSFTGDSTDDVSTKLQKLLLDNPMFLEDAPFLGPIMNNVCELPDGQWRNYESEISYNPCIDVSQPNSQVNTVDTIRNEKLVSGLLSVNQPILLVGPPGSGKTMSVCSVLRKSDRVIFVGMNFSKETLPSTLIKTLEQYATYKQRGNRLILSPDIESKSVVVFCDEINLPMSDEYGVQPLIELLRQMFEYSGFWYKGNWVTLENIQFVAACNPSTDPGRNKLSPRIVRKFAVFLVDYPGRDSLLMIYKSFNDSVLREIPNLKGLCVPLTNSMIEVYEHSRKKFIPSQRKHYVYSPRELTRWSKGIYEAVTGNVNMELDQFLRIWAHEAIRLFCDRLTNKDEKSWCFQMIVEVASRHFLNINKEKIFRQPMLYTRWISGSYESVDSSELLSFLTQRLMVYLEEESESPMVLHDDLLDHILRIERALNQVQGHLILVGPSATGKSSLTKFVCWMNQYTLVQLSTWKGYTILNFEEQLRKILVNTIKENKIVLLIDENDISDTSFIERMNNLLANAEIPGLFEGDDLSLLISLCQEAEPLLETHDEIFSWFSKIVAQRLHIVITINDPNDTRKPDLVSSPALFNRCVVNWLGDWSVPTLKQVCAVQLEDLDLTDYEGSESPGNMFRDNVIEAFVKIHLSVEFSEITPGYYQTFLETFVKLITKQGENMQDKQNHRNMGLDKLKQSVLEVELLKEQLSLKGDELQAKNAEANKTLDTMLFEQNEAEKKQEVSIQIQKSLEIQEKRIRERQEIVAQDLAIAEPAIVEAQQGVKNIKKQHLTELRSMLNPPVAIKLTLEAVSVLLGFEVANWREVLAVVRKDDFIASIVHFNGDEQITPELASYMEDTYLSRPNFNFESVNRASKACGPLLLWVQAQLRYSQVIEKVSPLRNEMLFLEEEASDARARLIALNEMIEELEGSINGYKLQYASLIREIEKIKQQMEAVENTLLRSVSLLESLAAERDRWSTSNNEFVDRRKTLVGDCLISAAFIAYCGFYGEETRKALIKKWKTVLELLNISCSVSHTIVNHLGVFGTLVSWEAFGLPRDNICIENMIILSQSSRFPFIIDPSGKILNVLTNCISDQPPIVTSFLDRSFVRQLENALRFGSTIILQDAEHYDPIIRPILGNTFERVGGRKLINIGENKIDFSPKFKLVLISKDPSIIIPSYVASRTTILNFTITENSVVSQVLNNVLRIRYPVVDDQRIEVIKINSEYQIQLRSLEDELLDKLSESEGNILENGELLKTLESLKRESQQLSEKIKDTENVITTIDELKDKYKTFAHHCSKIFQILQALPKLSDFYHVSVDYMMNICIYVLQISQDNNSLASIIKILYQEVFKRLRVSIKDSHENVFILMLLSSYFGPNYRFVEQVLEPLSSAPVVNATEFVTLFSMGLDVETEGNHANWLDDSVNLKDQNQLELPLLASSLLTENAQLKLSFSDVITHILFDGIVPYSLSDIATNSADSLVILCSTGHADVTANVQFLASESNVDLKIVSMGVEESVMMVKRELSILGDGWLLLENVQMSPSILTAIIEVFESKTLTKKIFMTCNENSNIPVPLLKMAKLVMVGEVPDLSSHFRTILNGQLYCMKSPLPFEKTHVFMLAGWLHYVIQERMRYAPLGFSKRYDFGRTDLVSSLYVIDKWIGSVSRDRTNINPDQIPWDAIKYVITEIVYGAQLETEEDRKIVSTLTSHLFRSFSFEEGFHLVIPDNVNHLALPDHKSLDSYIEWCESLPKHTPMKWIGLDDTVAKDAQQRQMRANLIDTITLLSEVNIDKH
ncbi:BA75_02408T0 [Komagataella pastoris]|uniref:Dynein heavy chain, cytoplasmic n=1 Tax=Komagataella pastoris TaxID=4922 RepID=A0A1B2JDX9_PICPA|nr:BA75_02408T0 [Komagataella pastoris]